MAAERAASNARLLRKLEEMTKERDDLKKKLDDAESSKRIMSQSTIDDLEEKLRSVNLSLSNKDSEVEKLQEELMKVKTQLNSKQRECNAVISDLEESRRELDEKKKELKDYKMHMDNRGQQQRSELENTLAEKTKEFNEKLKVKNNELYAKDDELANLRGKISQQNDLISSKTMELTTKDRELNDLRSKLQNFDRILKDTSDEKERITRHHEDQMRQQKSESMVLHEQLKSQIAIFESANQNLKADLQQAQQRIRVAEQNAQDEAQKSINEISSLQQNIKQLKVQLSQKANELQTRSAEAEQHSLNFSKLQGRFKNIVTEKSLKENELKKAYSEVEDTLSTLDDYAKQIQQARGDNQKLNQTMEQKDKEILRLKERKESIEGELKIRTEKINAHEAMIASLQQKNQEYRRQVQEYEAKCERLEGEVNRVNAQRLGLAGKNSREFTSDEVAVAKGKYGTPDQQKYHRPGGDSDPLSRSGGYIPSQPHQQQRQETPNRYNYQGQPPDRRGYDPIPGQPGDPRSPPHNQGPPPGNMRSPLYGTPPGNQGYPPYQPPPMNQAGGGYQQPQNQPLRHAGPVQANFSAELNSDPCPMCQKRFANSEVLANHAATCNYDRDNH